VLANHIGHTDTLRNAIDTAKAARAPEKTP
jgi:hypothetical protein